MAKQRKILVADDDRITREIIGAVLTRAGHEVVFAEDGKSAVELASSERPDLVFIESRDSPALPSSFCTERVYQA